MTLIFPLANIDIPLFGFFIIAPLFMIALHFNLLVHLQQHTGKVRAFLRQQSGSGREQDVNLPPFLFNYLQQFQPGHLQHRLLLSVLYVMVVLFPAVVLLYAQFKFSKYHSWAMTGWHYSVLLVELYVCGFTGRGLSIRARSRMRQKPGKACSSAKKERSCGPFSRSS